MTILLFHAQHILAYTLYYVAALLQSLAVGIPMHYKRKEALKNDTQFWSPAGGVRRTKPCQQPWGPCR